MKSYVVGKYTFFLGRQGERWVSFLANDRATGWDKSFGSTEHEALEGGLKALSKRCQHDLRCIQADLERAEIAKAQALGQLEEIAKALDKCGPK